MSDDASLTQRPGDWVSARALIDAIRLYAQQLYQDSSANGAGGVGQNFFAQLEADGFFAQIRAWGIPIDLESPFVKHFNDAGAGCDGVEPLRLVLLALERAQAVGCPIRKVSADEPLQSAKACGLTLQQTADLTAQNIITLRAWGQHDIDMTFGYRANTVEEIIDFTERVQQYGATRGAWTSQTGIDIDFDPYSLKDQFPDGYWPWQKDRVFTACAPELQHLHAVCQSWGIPLRFIPTTRGDTPETYRGGVFDSYQLIRRLLGRQPDAWILESWKGVPGGLPVNLPESDPTSATGLLRAIAADIEEHP